MIRANRSLPTPASGRCSATCEDQITSGAVPEDQRPACEAEALRTCSTNYYLRGYPEVPQAGCGLAGSSKKLNVDVQLSLFRGFGASDLTTADQTRGLQRWWEYHDVRFWTDRPSELASISHALAGSRAEFENALRAAGIDPNTPNPAAGRSSQG